MDNKTLLRSRHSGTHAHTYDCAIDSVTERSIPLTSDVASKDLDAPPEISIVLPCLNEEAAIGGCIDTLQKVIARQHLSAEILVVDNASTDRSAEIARGRGARVVYQPERGYGNAYLKGFAEARGTFIVMADSDETYDFNEVESLIEPLRHGYDLVMGNRFSGRMTRGAMTWSHRYIGNPALSGLLNVFFRTGIRDAHCGMRAFSKQAYERMRLRTGGMEFASEMVINAAKVGLKMTEIPVAYYPRVGESKLHTIRDGWRHLRFLLLYSPTHLFLLPGALLMLAGLVVLAALLPGPLPLFGHAWDVHAMILASLVTLIGMQIIVLGLFARFFSLTEELDGERDVVLQWISKRFTLERGLLAGVVILVPGLLMDTFIFVRWVSIHFGPFNEVRPAIVATTLIAIGTQVFFGSFFLSLLQFKKSIHASTVARAGTTATAEALTLPASHPNCQKDASADRTATMACDGGTRQERVDRGIVNTAILETEMTSLVGIMNEPPLKAADRLIQYWRIAKVRRYVPREAKVLDVGCADGALFRRLRRQISSGVGVDHALARSVGNANYRLIAGTLSDELVSSADFDIVTLLAVVEHLREEVIPELRERCERALKPGGLLLITVPSTQVDHILHFLARLHLIAGMSLHEHHGFNPVDVPDWFGSDSLTLVESRKFQLGLNNLFVFQRV